MIEDIIRCKDCEFCEKSNCWKWCEYMEVSPWRCTKGRGLDIAETVNLNDFYSSAKLREVQK